MAKTYVLAFGTGNPLGYTGLAPTFIQYVNAATGASLARPSITETPANSGLYVFSATPSFTISFVADGATTGIVDSLRYIRGTLEPEDDLFSSLTIITTLIGSTASSFGSTSVDPGTLFGYLKRTQETLEGDQVFNKTTGGFDMYARTSSGTTTLLRSKTLTNSASNVIKS